MGGPFGSDSRYTANVAEQVVNATELLVAEEWNKVPQEMYSTTCSRHDEETDDECVGLPRKQGAFPSVIISKSSFDGVDYE